MENSDYILELLKEAGLITDEQLDAAWQKVAESDGQLDVVDALVKLEFVFLWFLYFLPEAKRYLKR